MGRNNSIDTFCKVLQHFKNNPEYRSNKSLSEKLNVDRLTLGRYIKKIKAYELYEIYKTKK